MSAPPRLWPSELSPALCRDIRGWCELWNVPHIVPEISVAISRRMTTSLGRASYTKMLIKLQHTLLDPSAAQLLREVLCHELAHLAAYRLHGKRIRPHGCQWRALLVAAGYPPKVTIAAETLPKCFHIGAARKRRRPRRSAWKRLKRWVLG
ncbi:MAG: hypothetical protein EXS01_04090 [Phycisphaerales bacterium]|nr:hypothetical protein [Phycisphaerales bacterium]